MLSLASLFGLVLACGITSAQVSYCSRSGGICSYSACSRYYVSSSLQLCPNPYQRCCISEVCLTTLGGNCQNSRYTCNGDSFTHSSGFKRLCSQSTDRCCITSAPGRVTTTPSPIIPTIPVSQASVDKCLSYGGICADQTKYTCRNGEFKLLGAQSEILCKNWYSRNERCCMANKTGGVATPAPTLPAVKATSVPTSTGTNTGCGVRKIQSLNKRIVGGTAAQRGEWPWQTSIIKISTSGRSFAHTCGGTLISPQWVVSAAHCFQSVTSSYQLRVRVGEHSFLVDEGSESDATIANIIVHPQYIHTQNKNDIAMIKLSKPLNVNTDYVGTACLPDVSDMSDFYKTSECYTTGWGNTRGTGGDSRVLQKVQSTLVSQSQCYSKWGYKIDSTKVCFGNGYRGACKGDSGGPLVCKKNGVFNLVGVVSYGTSSCTEKYVPTVYTSVASYKTWIQQVMAKY